MVGRPWAIALLYLGITIAMTWPIAARIDRDLPSDLGDPAFVAGVMAWGAEHWIAFFQGDLGAAARFWDAPIFHPEPLTLAYSEHFALQSLITLPAYALTRNPVLGYNLAFLATFVLAGLGMYLLVRDLIGGGSRFSAPAFVAGLAFAFTPYRVATLPHLQVLSSQWMPFVLLGIHRYVRDRSSDALTGAGAALWAQNLSSGYYMLFFTPFAALYALVAMWGHAAYRSVAAWRGLLVMGGISMLATLPFAIPYWLRTQGTRRSLDEVIWFSADLEGWLTASPLLHVWGHLQTLVKAEGFLFPGVTVVVLAVVGLWQARRVAPVAVAFAGLALVLSFWLSLGPQIQVATQPVDFPALYRPLWAFVPGFNAARVPARFATVTVLALALLAGVALTRWNSGRRRWIIAVCGALIVAEGAAAPLPTNGIWTSAPEELKAPAARLYRLRDAPPVFRYLATLETHAVVAHFPFGVPEREIQYGYYAMLHGTSTVNGYSGAFPPSYNIRLGALRHPLADPDAMHFVLDLDGVTHVVVHTGAYLDAGGRQLIERLADAGWAQVARFGDDYVLRRRP